MSYRLQAHIWQLCVYLATLRFPCIDLHKDLKKKKKTHPNIHLSSIYQIPTLHKAVCQFAGPYKTYAILFKYVTGEAMYG